MVPPAYKVKLPRSSAFGSSDLLNGAAPRLVKCGWSGAVGCKEGRTAGSECPYGQPCLPCLSSFPPLDLFMSREVSGAHGDVHHAHHIISLCTSHDRSGMGLRH